MTNGGKTSNGDRIGLRVASAFACLAVLLGASAGGCAQNTDGWLGQPSDQRVDTPSITDQDSAAQGSQVYVYVINSPHGDEMPGDGQDPFLELVTTSDGGGEPATVGGVSEGESEVQTAEATYAQSGVSITINTGNTTPTQTGTTAPTVTGTQSPGATQTQTPTQDITSELAASVPVGVALPGGIADVGGTANVGEGSATQDKQATHTLRQAWAQVDPADPASLAEFLKLAGRVLGTPPDGDVPNAE